MMHDDDDDDDDDDDGDWTLVATLGLVCSQLVHML